MARVQIASTGAGNVTYKDGSAFSGATVTIYNVGTASLSTIYAARSGGSSISYPVSC